MDIPSWAQIKAEMLEGSPFQRNAWPEYEAAVDRFVGTFDPPCQALYGLVRALAEVNYPDPGRYDEARGILLAFDKEYLVGLVNVGVRPQIEEFERQTCFDLRLGDWFDPTDPSSSVISLFDTIKGAIGDWSESVPASPDSDGPRWEPARPGSKNLGILSFRGRSAPAHSQAKVMVTVLDAFENVSWSMPVSLTSVNNYPSALHSLYKLALRGGLPLEFFYEGSGDLRVCRWRQEPVCRGHEGGRDALAETGVGDAS